MRSFSFLLVTFAGFGSLSACSKMDPKDCAQLRESSFELINAANNCSTDSDCRPTEWPGCQRPINAQNFDAIHQKMESFRKGKCEEKPANCKQAPAVYCAEGICAFRYKGTQQPGDVRFE
jgi:hypothetical protein